jgi:hypothetical protein
MADQTDNQTAQDDHYLPHRPITDAEWWAMITAAVADQRPPRGSE